MGSQVHMHTKTDGEYIWPYIGNVAYIFSVAAWETNTMIRRHFYINSPSKFFMFSLLFATSLLSS